jgi:16S rRNA (guanine966-N2)-methyltransferase
VRIIAGEWRGRRLRTPAGGETRPTSDRVREAWFSVMGPSVEGARVLDLFSGSGALGLEALSRGAREVVFVEKGRRPLHALEDNIRSLGAGDRASVVRGDAMAFARRLEAGSFDLALADPPYGRGFAEALVRRFREVPFAQELWVEHRTTDHVPLEEGDWQRRYGDTALTCVSAGSRDPGAGIGQQSPEPPGVDQ